MFNQKGFYKFRNINLAVSAILVFILSSCGSSGSTSNVPVPSATLEWEIPTSYEDGSTPLTDISGYRVFYGESSKSYDESFDIGPVTSIEIDNLEFDKEYFFAIKTIDFRGNTSNFSSEVSVVIQH